MAHMATPKKGTWRNHHFSFSSSFIKIYPTISFWISSSTSLISSKDLLLIFISMVIVKSYDSDGGG